MDPDKLFPQLTDAHITRVASLGRRRPITRGDVLMDIGDRSLAFFVVLRGEIRWTSRQGGSVEARSIRHVFMMTGAVPNTSWLSGCLALDDKGFIKTGPALSSEGLTAAGWPLIRPPLLLETRPSGVFAVGDVRGGNVKRVASAVGEGSIAVAFVHQVLQIH